VGCGRNQNFRDSRPWLATSGNYGRGELAVTGGDVVVDGRPVQPDFGGASDLRGVSRW
jgi:hypothetical protein